MHSQLVKKILALTEIAVIVAGVFTPMTLDWPEKGKEIGLAQWLQNLSKVELEKQEAEAAAGSWYNPSWPYRKKLVVDHKKISGPSQLTGFPLLISRTDNDLKGSVSGGFVQRVGGTDILFTDLAGVKLSHEIESYTPTTGNLVTWVKASPSPNFDQAMYMYYGNSTASNQQNVAAVWDSDYKGVWHLHNSSSPATDSTSNAKNGTQSGGVTFGATGKINGANSFDGTDDYLSVGNVFNGIQTASFWVKADNLTKNIIDLNGSAIVEISSGAITATGWTSPTVYVDGVVASTIDTNWHFVTVTTGTGINASAVDIGRVSTGFFPGTLDEPRLSNSARSAAWIKTEYNNQNSPSTFAAFGKQEVYKRTTAATKVGKTSTITGNTWYSSSWPYRKKLVVDHKKISGPSQLTGFPMLISRTDTDLKGSASGGFVQRVGGTDILFTDIAGVKLSHEVESYTPTTGNLVTWVKASPSPNFDQVMYMYYGATGQTAQANAASTWDSNYQGVWHLGEGDSTAAEFYKDSTRTNNGTLVDANGGVEAITGQINGALDFDANTGDVLNTADDNDLDNASQMTLSAWVRADALADFSAFIMKDTSDLCFSAIQLSGASEGLNNDMTAAMSNSGTAYGYTTNNSVVTGEWRHWTMAFDGTQATNATRLKLYRDGVEQSLTFIGTISTATCDTNTGVVEIGSNAARVGYFWNGGIDEARTSNTNRSSAWIQTEFTNQNSPSSFAAFGKQEVYKRTAAGTKVGKTSTLTGNTWYSSSWPYRKKIVVNHKKISGPSQLTGFPLLISRTDNDLKGSASGGFVQRVGGTDILFTDIAGVKLSHEIESYAPTTGNLVTWVKASPSPNFDQVMYMYYGATGQTAQANAASTWDSNYQGVWHLSETPNATVMDSTSGGNNGSPTNMESGDQIATKIDGGLAFDGSNEVVAVTTINSAIATAANFTISMWAFADPALLAINPFALYRTSDNQLKYVFKTTTSGTVQMRVIMSDVATNVVASDPVALDSNIWHLWTASYDGSALVLYKDGQQVASTASTITLFTSVDTIDFARQNATDGAYWGGRIDETRISSTARTAAWIKTEYNNQNSPSTFVAFGPREARVKTVPTGRAR